MKWIKVFKDSPIYQLLKQIFGHAKSKDHQYLDLPIAKMLLLDRRTSSGTLNYIVIMWETRKFGIFEGKIKGHKKG